ncbi:GNAT family N-acetyltransferase [Jiella endophytica]|uniref:GNAT family N-acetyltransferase n=1 Tax=Jiella endophytica TaxID=2558362 RepID=A0A4Y8RPF4_9HYPH|nr:GNAT family N-acetyltransferase [Jiella endophytica]TFF25532.1 GNAT family N-acetyltransferase [Jiella endophytica]
MRPAGDDDVEAVAALLHDRMNGRIPAETWRLLLDYPWRPPEAERGWLVEDDGQIVGFMGTVYSDRPTATGTRRFCDLSSWYLVSGYRGTGVGDELLRSGMEKPGVTYQTMTARRATGRKIRALGFSILDETRSLFRPGDAAQIGNGGLRLIRDPAEIRERLSPDERRMLDDHHGFDIHHAVIEDGDGSAGEAGRGTWLVWQRKLKGDAVAYHEVLHACDYDFLSAHAGSIAGLVSVGEKAVLAVDTRMMNGADDQGEVEKIPLPRWYRSDDVQPRDIGHLYSEVLLLDQKLP